MFGIQTILSTFVLAAIPAPQDATLLFVTTPGCAACQQFAPLVREIAEAGYAVETVDAAQHADLVRNQLMVQEFPTFIMVSHDRIVDRVLGSGNPMTLKPRIMYMFERAAEQTRKNGNETGTVAPANVLNVTPNVTAETNTAENTNISPWITSSVKLRVDDTKGHSWGTGTIIDTRKGEALILTCGHIFRESQGKGNIEVHLFGQNSSVRVFGRCLHYDLEIDLALVAIVPPCPVQAIPIAPPQYQITSNQRVLSVGCDSGANPSIWEHYVISTDRIGTPQTNAVPFRYIQVHGAPVGGRSGGGLFTEDGYLIGVCNTADPVQNDGQFVPPQMIRYVLHQIQLSEIYENPSLVDHSLTAPAMTATAAPSAIPATPSAPIISPVSQLEPLKAVSVPQPIQSIDDGLDAQQRATLDEIKRRKQDGDEVILIVRSRRNPEIPSDVIILNGTSDQFIDALAKHEPISNEPSYNSVIFSSHETPLQPSSLVSQPVVTQPFFQSQSTASRQPVSFPVSH